MKTIRIYQPFQFETGQSYPLDKAASNHLVRVLRLKNQQAFTLFNGNGGEYSAILEISGKKATAHIQTFTEIKNESNLNIHLLQGISKGERMDFAVQKSVELGVNSITPVITERTVVNLKGERLEKKILHWQNIAISACEQSGRCLVPEILPACSLSKQLETNTDTTKLILDPLSKTSLHSIKSQDNNISILIGPEGGLSDLEIDNAKQNGFTGVKLGPRILRTETAALAAITAVQLLQGDFQ